jgi:hypothetical protein
LEPCKWNAALELLNIQPPWIHPARLRLHSRALKHKKGEENKFRSYRQFIAVPFWSQHVCKVVSPIAHLDCDMNRIQNRSIWCDSLFLAPPCMSEH